ncbi:MAG: DNA polymerase IV [Oscillospiraceae bacterium]|nr:DNA polymerase IV [Oscillospiraceae bacterium]
MERTILHCDLNAFYASVEILLNPELKGKAVAVCGSKEDRHGIVLAKSDLAKKYGVQTGEAIWQAQQKCPDLITVPPRFDEYMKYSAMARRIYEDYTDLIEPFGIDECWLDVTASRLLFGSGEEIAQELRRRLKEEVGLTISVGVSFNKIFAKLGSDLKKPDAVTVIPKESFRSLIGGLPASDMLGVGRSSMKFLKNYGIRTINELADMDVRFLEDKLGKCGRQIWLYANGLDDSPVRHMCCCEPIKSVGHGTTCTTDLFTEDEVWQVIFGLSQDVSKRLRKYKLRAGGVQIAVKDNLLRTRQYQHPLIAPVQSFAEIAENAFSLFRQNYKWERGVRALTVRTINLLPEADDEPQQLFFEDSSASRREKRDRIELAIERIRSRYGNDAINMGSLFAADDITAEEIPNTMPTGMRLISEPI